MGYVPEWQRGNHAKTSGTAKTQSGVRSVELFHNAPKPGSNADQTPFTRHYADGGDVELNVNGDTVGAYSGNDEIVKYRMNQIDASGADLRIPESAKVTQAQRDVQDMEGSSSSDYTPTSTAAASGVKPTVTVEAPAAKPARVNASKSSSSSSKPAPQSQYVAQDAAGDGDSTARYAAQDIENGPGVAPKARYGRGQAAVMKTSFGQSQRSKAYSK